MRGEILGHTEKLVVEICCACHMTFAMPLAFRDSRRADKQYFQCPAGHSQNYTGISDEEKFNSEKQKRIEAENRVSDLLKQRNKIQREFRIATTKTKKGVCPCCNKEFSHLKRHIAYKHPEYFK